MPHAELSTSCRMNTSGCRSCLLQLVTCLVDVGFRHVEPFGEVRGRGLRLLRQNHEDSLLQGERFKRCILRSSLGMGTKG